MSTRKATIVLLALVLCCTPLAAQGGGAQPVAMKTDAAIAAALAGISPDSIRATLQQLVGFGTRHAASDTLSATRGIGAARRWIHARFEEFSRRCHGCLDVRYDPHDVVVERFKSRPTVRIVNVVARLKGRTDPNRIVLVEGHYDSCICSIDPEDAVSDAPGANDDGSGTALVIELARVLSKAFPSGLDATVLFVPVAGEEQGLLGSSALARELMSDSSLTIAAVMSNDIVGNVRGEDGRTDSLRVRVFGPEPDDGVARHLARMAVRIGAAYVPGFEVSLIQRLDRIGRGGDHRPFWQLGAPAVRVTESLEDYNRQHRPADTPDFVSPAYIRKVAIVNGAVLAEIASAPAAPRNPRMQRDRDSGGGTWKLSWDAVQNAPDLAGYQVTVRKTTDTFPSRVIPVGNVTRYTLENTQADDLWIGVRAVDRDGHVSLITSFHADARVTPPGR